MTTATNASPAQLVETLTAHLRLDPTADDVFQGQVPNFGWGRVFGGLVIAQGVVAAMETIEAARPIHSMHAYFIRPGDPTQPITYRVTRLRDGRSFSTRLVMAEQNEKAILTLTASFQIEEKGLEHQVAMPDVPDPGSLPSEADIMAQFADKLPDPVKRYLNRPRPIEIRPTDLSRFSRLSPLPPRQAVWFRAKAPLEDNEQLHCAVLTYASDMTLLDTALFAHGRSVFSPELQVASLDHSVWYHRPTRFDEWHLYVQDSPVSSMARGVTRGLIYHEGGQLIASVAQEGLIRER